MNERNQMTTGSFSIRPAVLEDFAAIAALAHGLGFPSPVEDVRRRLAQILQKQDHQVFVAGENGSLLFGFLHIHQNFHIETDTFAEIDALVVASQYQRLGLGRQLFLEAVEWCRERRIRNIRCHNHTPDIDSIAFFNKLNFRQLNPQIVFVYHLHD